MISGTLGGVAGGGNFARDLKFSDTFPSEVGTDMRRCVCPGWPRREQGRSEMEDRRWTVRIWTLWLCTLIHNGIANFKRENGRAYSFLGKSRRSWNEGWLDACDAIRLSGERGHETGSYGGSDA